MTIPVCPETFWLEVARIVADRIVVRESSVAGINLREAATAKGTAARIVEQFQTPPPDGPRAA